MRDCGCIIEQTGSTVPWMSQRQFWTLQPGRLVWESIRPGCVSESDDGLPYDSTIWKRAARAQHIAIMDSGKIKEVGTPLDLKEKYAEDTLRLTPMQDKERELTEALQGHSYQKVQEAYHLQVAKSMDALPVIFAKAKPYITGFEDDTGNDG